MEFELWLSLVLLFFTGGLTPGPAVMLVLATSFRHGFKPALLPAMGVASANVIWLILAASGTAVLFELYPRATLFLKFLGVAVLVYMAISVMFGPTPKIDKPVANGSTDVNTIQSGSAKLWTLYFKGVLLQITSPMPLVYFGMLLPLYFVADKALAPQFLIMLVTITSLEMFGLSVYAYAAQKIRHVLNRPRTARIFNMLIGVVMLASGLFAIFFTA